LEIASDYGDFKDKIKKIISDLEEEQISKGVGMTKIRSKPKKEISDMISIMSIEKYGYGCSGEK